MQSNDPIFAINGSKPINTLPSFVDQNVTKDAVDSLPLSNIFALGMSEGASNATVRAAAINHRQV